MNDIRMVGNNTIKYADKVVKVTPEDMLSILANAPDVAKENAYKVKMNQLNGGPLDGFDVHIDGDNVKLYCGKYAPEDNWWVSE